MITFIFSVRQWLRITTSIIYLICIALLSLLPPKELPEVQLFSGADKIIHTFMYLGLTWLACWAMHAEIKNTWYYIIILFSIGWGIIMEIFQLQMHVGRSFEYLDILSNSAGTLIGIFIYILFALQKKKMDIRKAATV